MRRSWRLGAAAPAAAALVLATVAPARANSVESTGIVITIGTLATSHDDNAQADRPVVKVGRALDIEGRPVTAIAIATLPQSSGPGMAPLRQGRLSSLFGLRRHPLTRQARMHSGVDIAAPAGTPVYATSAGRVSQANWAGSYGLFVALDHAGGLQTRYAHLSRILVAPGQMIRKGDIIGLVGSTGRSTGSHLHYETRLNGMATNPLALHAAPGRKPAGESTSARPYITVP